MTFGSPGERVGELCAGWCVHVDLVETLRGNWLEIFMNCNVKGTEGGMRILRAW